MEQLNIAILEDNPILLKDLIGYIKDLKLASIKVQAQNTTDFLEKLKGVNIDAIVLDIDISGDSMNGIDVANHLNLPTLFITGKTKEYLSEIEELRLFHDQPVEFLTKPIREDKLKIVFEKFETQIKNFVKAKFLEIKLKNGFHEKLNQADIVLIESIPNSKNNSKNIFTSSDNKPFEVSNKSMEDLFKMGLSEESFTKVHQSYILNNRYLDIKRVHKGGNNFEIKYDVQNKEQTKEISLSREYLKSIRKS